MKKRGIILSTKLSTLSIASLFIILFFLVSIPLIISQSIDVPIKKITDKAEQYETGNINYAQLIVYTTTLSKDLAEEMGAITKEQSHEAVLKAEQLEKSLGKPTDMTRWVWVESGDGDGYEKKLDQDAPGWRKIIFDGKKMQIWLEAWPYILEKNNEDVLFYRLHTDIRFKEPGKSVDVKGKIEEIKSLAERYSENPSDENLKTLAEESVAAEQSFQEYFRENPVKCEEMMNDIFGNENKRENQDTLSEEIILFEGDNFEFIMNLEMCDSCEWNWINFNTHFESRGRFEHPEESQNFERNSFEKYSGYSDDKFKEETRNMVEEIKNELSSENYQSALEKAQELRMLTEAWNEKSNNVWQEIEQDFRMDFETMSQEEREKCHKEYCWIKKEQERRAAEKSLRKGNYEGRKQFYLDLFSDYNKKESYYEQEMWEKRIVEQFKEFGQESCDNNADDNNNGQIDCSDSQCGGKVCGYETVTVNDGNETRDEKIALYCIAGTCQAKEEIITEKTIVCGNHICEEGEKDVCLEDCSICEDHSSLECVGTVIFSGHEENGCPLEPICLPEDQSCESDADCTDPLCGQASCIEGKCKITELTECKEAECIDGEEKIQHCEEGESKITEKCIEGLWVETGIACEVVSEQEEVVEEDTLSNECTIKSDCGNEDDVCSNGKCVTIPQTADSENQENQEIEDEANEEREQEIEQEQDENEIKQEETESQQQTEQNEEETSEEQEPGITGEVIFSFFKTFTNKITGFQIEGGDNSGEGTQQGDQETQQEGNSQEDTNQEDNSDSGQGNQENNENNEQERREEERNDQDDHERENEDRRREENERRGNECSERCDRECYDREIRPCVEDCIREQCGNELECNVDEVRKSCESKCESENSVESCKNECSGKCLEGKETWVEPEREEHKEEKFVFTVGGSCKKSQGKTESYIWFGGWGDEFRDFHIIKQNYYTNGNADWCEEDLKNLERQRKELEKSLNQEFATWFFEKYVSNSADDWEKHISGIFELYWRDVDISRQMAERMKCLKRDSLPEHNLINFKYETDYGSVEFWEEIKTAKINENEEEAEIISPYMKIWLFPSRDFFKAEMKKSMETHKLPGPPEEEQRNKLSEDEKRELREDEEFMDRIRSFNENGENLVIQFKDFDTNEVVFNIYMRINEQELIYFEPMPPSEIPAEDVKVELDINKLLDIIEYSETGRVELESPPWDRQPRVGTIKNVIDSARMFFMFRSLMNSAVVTPQSAKEDSLFFVRNFFEVVMGDENRGSENRDNEEEKNFDETIENSQQER